MKNLILNLIFIISTTILCSQEMQTTQNNLVSNVNTLVKKAFDNFKPDLKRIGKTTAKWDNKYVKEVSHDVTKFAEANYIKAVDVTLLSSDKTPIKAAKYYVHVKSEGSEKSSENWPNIENSTLAVVLHYNALWHSLTKTQKTIFMKKNEFNIAWIASDIDLSYANLKKN